MRVRGKRGKGWTHSARFPPRSSSFLPHPFYDTMSFLPAARAWHQSFTKIEALCGWIETLERTEIQMPASLTEKGEREKGERGGGRGRGGDASW